MRNDKHIHVHMDQQVQQSSWTGIGGELTESWVHARCMWDWIPLVDARFNVHPNKGLLGVRC